jgi:hypothetical protein
MNTTQIITIILTSSLLSSVLTAWVNWLLQKNNYKNDFYKKLLDKRISAYEEIEKLLVLLKTLVHIEKDKLCPQFCHFGKEYFDNFVISLAATSLNSFWLSNEMSHKITEFNIFLLQEIDYNIDENKNEDEELIRLGIINRERIKELRLEIEKIMYQDLKKLHDIKAFTKKFKIEGEQLALYDKDKKLKKTGANST